MYKIKDIDVQYINLIVKNIEKGLIKKSLDEILERNIDSGFNWDKTAEGHAYWSAVHRKYMNNAITYPKKEETSKNYLEW